MNRRSLKSGSHKSAFTLIELLVALAIISILAAVLFPVFSSARANRNASCLSNHRQLAEAVSLYIQDYNASFIPSPTALDTYLPVNNLAKCPLQYMYVVGDQHYCEARGHSNGLGSSGKANDSGGDDGDDDDNELNPGSGGGDQHFAGGGGSSSPNMTYHAGTIMATATTAAIYWGTSWGNSTFVGDKITGLDSWYVGFNGSHYAVTSDEYTGTNGTVTASTTHLGHLVDVTPAPTGAPTTAQILAEVCSHIANPVSNGYYAVYVDTPRGTNGFCAWHSWGTCGSVPVQIAFHFSLDGDAGCNPSDASGLHSQGLAALANVTGHELSEARTDPRGIGWFDSAGAENGDKCAWTYGAPLVTFSNGTQWKIQGEWSNKAYTKGTGYANLSGQKGCISGL